MKIPTTKFVFDRKHQASKSKKAPVMIEVYFNRKRKYIGTGVKLYIDQWDDRKLVKNAMDMIVLNDRINTVKNKIDGWITSLVEKGHSFEWEKLDAFLRQSDAAEKKFTDFVKALIETRTDILPSTKRNHRKVIKAVEEFGEIVYFSDLTRANIIAFDDFIKKRDVKQTTVFSYHKELKAYINEAIRRELIDRNPYDAIKIKRGESEDGRFLTPDEINAIKDAILPTESLNRVRDLFLLQCYTGMAYSDIMAFDFQDVEYRNGQFVLSEKRQKTGVPFVVVLVPDAMEIIEKYNRKLPKISNVQYNLRLKLIADAAGIDKPIASHWGRRTCGMYLLNKGFSMEIVAKVLGHKSIRTTEAVYAKILDKSVEEAFRKLNK